MLAGHRYRPPRIAPDERTPAMVMCGPFSSVKEQTLPHYAERLADASYTVLLPEFAQEAYDAAVGSKELIWIETPNHIELYDQNPYVDEVCARLTTWLSANLQ